MYVSGFSACTWSIFKRHNSINRPTISRTNTNENKQLAILTRRLTDSTWKMLRNLVISKVSKACSLGENRVSSSIQSTKTPDLHYRRYPITIVSCLLHRLRGYGFQKMSLDRFMFYAHSSFSVKASQFWSENLLSCFYSEMLLGDCLDRQTVIFFLQDPFFQGKQHK